MRFGPVPVAEAEGAILAHSTTAGGKRFRKGHRLSRADLDLMAEAGISELIVVCLAEDDIGEDEAATRIAEALTFRNIEIKPAATGRVNLHSTEAGVFRVDRPMIDAINAVDPAVTIATLEDYAVVEAGKMVATIKIIPFAAPGPAVAKAIEVARRGEVFSVEPFRPHKVAVIQTVLPSVKPSVLDKTARITAARLERSGSRIVAEQRPAHDAGAVAEAVGKVLDEADLVTIFGASAMSDFDDVIPAAIRAAGGRVERAGMPVDPGNLLVLGEIAGKPVLGAPGCARSPAENGFDWVLDRILSGIQVTTRDIAGMGVGGLLMEIVTRPQPREAKPLPAASVHAVVLAAGRSSRMGGPNKLLAAFGGKPLVRRSVEQAMTACPGAVTVVVGHQAARVRGAIDGLPVAVVENPDFALGLSTSLKAGLRAVPSEAAGALVMLADMPDIGAAELKRLIAAFDDAGGSQIVRATHGGKRGNPVILPRATFAEVEKLEGDTGARHIVEAGGGAVIDVELGEAASVDVDTPEALAEAGGVLQG